MAVASESVSVPTVRTSEHWPAEVKALFKALQRPAPFGRDRRRRTRRQHQVEGVVYLPGVAGQPAYVSDYDAAARTISFVLNGFARVGTGCALDVALQTAEPARLRGKVVRMNQFRDGWFHCVMQIDGKNGATC
jgi:hypothetical protein